MAELRGGSTVGGKPIATADMVNKLISSTQIQDLVNKMNKFETTDITTLASLNSIFKDSSKNGVYQISNIAPDANIYEYGGLFSSGCNTYGFQIYYPEKDSSAGTSSAMYFRTKNSSTLRNWERVATYSYTDALNSLKFDKSGGTIAGDTTISAALTANKLVVNNVITSTANGNSLTLGSSNSNYCSFLNSADVPFSFNNNIITSGEMYATTVNKVWHAGNLSPADYTMKSIQLSNNFDLDTLITEGKYRCLQATNRPSKILNWAYVEVIRHDEANVLQKIYNYEGSHNYIRNKVSGFWSEWIPLAGNSSYIFTIDATTDWTLDSLVSSETKGLYYITITHNLNSENITSITLTDTAKALHSTGYSTVDSNKSTLWCDENPTGKVIINAIP